VGQTKRAVCHICGRAVLRRPGELKKNKHNFCSIDCYRKHQATTGRAGKACKSCGETFWGFSSLLKKNECCSRICSSLLRRKRHGRKAFLDDDGYWCITPKYSEDGGARIRVHSFIAAKALGRPLKDGEIVHHVNLNTKDNRHRNLLICTKGYHRKIHSKMAYLYAAEHLAGAA
jgi:hypothetical protein